jgi:ABC-type transport system involved in cytochrome bd biosynthesis fused ATPase/permease subunit
MLFGELCRWRKCEEYPLQSSAIAYVPQEPMLFHASIKENIILASPQASEED